MWELQGEYNKAKIFTENIESEAVAQIMELCNQEWAKDTNIAIMPDVHAGKGCTIGTTMTINDKVCPNLVGVDIGCLDKESEYLTLSGWKKMSEYAESDLVLGFDPNTNQADFVKPLAYIVKPCKQFYHYKNEEGLDQMVSEEHKMLIYSDYESRGYKYTDMRPSELNSESLEKGRHSFETVFKREHGSLTMSDNQIRLAVMIAADGRIRPVQNGYSLELHLKKNEKIQRAQELLSTEGIPFSMSVIQDGFTIIHATVESMYNKDLTFLYQGNSAQLKVAAEESLKWDGHEGYRSFYLSTNKRNVDAIQYAFHGSGVRAGISVTHYENKNWKDVYTVTPTQNSKVGYNKQPSLEPAIDGKKYCFTMPQGYFVARRNGKIFLTGNCGMLTVNLGEKDLDLELLDQIINTYVPSGFNVHDREAVCLEDEGIDLKQLYCYKALKEIQYIRQSVGTLGGGNHFIEVDEGADGTKYLVIHSGSRNLGKQVAEYYQNMANEDCNQQKKKRQEALDSLINSLKNQGRYKEIEKEIKLFNETWKMEEKIPKELCYLTGEHLEWYLHDVKICQQYADLNRRTMANIILNHLCLNIWKTPCKYYEYFSTIHNYIDVENKILRKGSISAQKGEKVLIPINMRDGAIIGIGKGNAEYNYSGPHGAGRIMSRSKAKEKITLEEFQKSMEGIYSTSIKLSTIDEAPMAYKKLEDILENIADSIEVQEVIKPIYNFKAH